MKILVVDDSQLVLLVMKKKLTKLGLDVCVADSGAEAVSIAQIEKPDLIFLDIMMPEMDGFETCRKIREINSLQRIPIVMLTVKRDDESVAEAIWQGALEELLENDLLADRGYKGEVFQVTREGYALADRLKAFGSGL